MRGSFGAGPQKTLDEVSLASGGQRWRFTSLRDRLGKTSARPAALPSIDFNKRLGDVNPDDSSISHFAATLALQSESNITATFRDYIREVKPLSLSLPLLFRNRKKILNLTLNTLVVSTERGAEASTAVANCLSALSKDLGPEHLHPFFPEVVKALAGVLDTARGTASLKGGNDSAAATGSVLWNPEESLVPLFATLAELTKSQLRELAAGGLQTILDLMPLLANPHYRVREMTAEACLGYLIKKTRDSKVLENLVQSMFEVCPQKNFDTVHIAYATDGLGAALFEAMRLPAGRLHSRALKVFTTGMRKLVSFSSKNSLEEEMSATEQSALEIVAKGMARMCRHLSVENDIEGLCGVLVKEMDIAIAEGRAHHAGDVCYLLRKWFLHGGSKVISLLNGPYLQKSLNGFSRCCEAFSSHPRVVWEALEAIRVVRLKCSDDGFRISSMRLFSGTALRVSKSSCLTSLSAAMAVLVRLQEDMDIGRLDTHLERSCLSLCEQMAKVSKQSLSLRDSAAFEFSEEALKCAISYMFTSQKSLLPFADSSLAFKVPTLEKQISALLNSFPFDSEGDVAKIRDRNVIYKSLLYLCNVRLVEKQPLFERMMRSKYLQTEELAMLVIACLYQHHDKLLQSQSALQATNEVVIRLLKERSSLKSPLVLLAVERYVCHNLLDSKQVRKSLSDEYGEIQDMLISGLSSADSNVRVRSVALLAPLARSFEDDGEDHDDASNQHIVFCDSEQMHDDALSALRKAFLEQSHTVSRILATLYHLSNMPTSLRGMQYTQRLQNELLRLLSSCSSVDSVAVRAIVSFTIGQIRTPFQALWSGAGDLWAAVAVHDEKTAMSTMMVHLDRAGSKLLEKVPGDNADGSTSRAGHDDNADEELLQNEDMENDAEDARVNVGAPSNTSVQERQRQKDTVPSFASRTERKGNRPASRDVKGYSWNHMEWKENIKSTSSGSSETSRVGMQLMFKSENSTDDLSFLLELLKVMARFPRHTHAFRESIIKSFLRLEPDLFSRRTGDKLALGYATLLEKMGGLKCCENDRELEGLMRNRLLTNLTRSDARVQAATVRCLCISRSPSLKPHLESFLRLVQQSTFREELSALTQSLFSTSSNDINYALSNQEDGAMMDVLIRICFSKMKGKKDKMESRRTAVLSFIASKLPLEVALPRITELIVAPMKDVVQELKSLGDVELGGVMEEVRKVKYPHASIQSGVLNSVEALLKQTGRSLPQSCFTDASLAVFAVLKWCGGSPGAQTLRSRSLRILGDMSMYQSETVNCLVLPTLQVAKSTVNERTGTGSGQGTPALLHFLYSVFSSSMVNEKRATLQKETWALTWSIGILSSENVDPPTVELVLSLSEKLVEVVENTGGLKGDESRDKSLLPVFRSLTSLLAASLRSLIQRLMRIISQEKRSHKIWITSFQQALRLIGKLIATCSIARDALSALCQGLVSFIEGSSDLGNLQGSALKSLTVIMTELSQGRELSERRENTELEVAQRAVFRLLPLFGDQIVNRKAETYSDLCEVFSNVGMPDCRAAMILLRDMFAMSDSKLETPDIDRRIKALNSTTSAFKVAVEQESKGGNEVVHVSLDVQTKDGSPQCVNCGSEAVMALAYGCLASVKFDDIAVRGTAGYALQVISKWVASSKSDVAYQARVELFKVLLSAVAFAKVFAVRKEYCRSLGEFVRMCTTMKEEAETDMRMIFSALQLLSRPTDLDSDFFENLVHLQAHRRSRALRQIDRQIFGNGSDAAHSSLGKDVLSLFAQHFSIPLALNVALEVSENVDKQSIKLSRKVESRESVKQDVIIWAVSLAGSSAACLVWSQYQTCIFSLMKRLKSSDNEDQTKTLYKLLVKVVEEFPKVNAEDESAEPIRDVLVGSMLPKLLAHITAGAVEGQILDVDTRITERGGGGGSKTIPHVFRAPVAVAVAHLLTCLPSSDIDVMIPLLITPLTNALRSRMSAIRDSAKKALTEVTLKLGFKHLPYILRGVLAALKEGFRKDSCVYVIHYLLLGIQDSVLKKSEAEQQTEFPFDDATTIIAEYLAEELETGVSASNNDFQDPNATASRQKQASLRASRVFECVEVMATSINFAKSASALTDSFQELLLRSTSTKLLARLDSVLERLVRGFSRNTSMKAADGLMFSYHCLCEPFPDLEELVSFNAGSNEVARLKSVNGNNYRLISFGLQLLDSVISKHQNDLHGTSASSKQLQSVLEPFLPLLVESLESRQDHVTLRAMKAAQRLMKVPLTDKTLLISKMSDVTVEILSQKAGVLTNTDELFNSCLRSGAALIHEAGPQGFKVISRDRVEALVAISCTCIETGGVEARSAALAVLKATVAAKAMIPAVYDAIQKVNRMAIRSQSSPLRAACTSLSISFMVSFPLGSKRVRQHLEFFVRNLNYKLANGRLASLEALRMIILKFPPEVLEGECEYLFISLAATAARDSDAQCRSNASRSLQFLFERVPEGKKVTDMLKMGAFLVGVQSLMTSPSDEMKVVPSDADVRLSGAIALGGAIKSGRMTPLQLEVILRVLTISLKDTSSTDRWEADYAILQAVELAFSTYSTQGMKRRLERDECTRSLWNAMPELLVHRHQWIRLSCARLLGSHLSACLDRDESETMGSAKSYSLVSEESGLVRSVLKSCCLQLEASEFTEALAQQCLKNILCIAKIVHKNPAVGNIGSQEGGELKHGAVTEHEMDAENRGLVWLISRMSGLAIRFGESESDMLRRGCALRFLLVTTKWWGVGLIESHLEHYIGPVVKILESNLTGSGQLVGGEQMNGTADVRSGLTLESEQGTLTMNGLKTLATLLQEGLLEELGVAKYYEVYHELRKKRDTIKAMKKRKAAVELAANPEGVAKKRRKKAESRKRKRGKESGMSNGRKLTEDL